MDKFDARFHTAHTCTAKALEFIERLKRDNPSPHWRHIEFTLLPAPRPSIGVWIKVDCKTHAAHCFATEELTPRGFDVPLHSRG